MITTFQIGLVLIYICVMHNCRDVSDAPVNSQASTTPINSVNTSHRTVLDSGAKGSKQIETRTMPVPTENNLFPGGAPVTSHFEGSNVIHGAGIESTDIVVNSPKTRAFLSNFSNPLQIAFLLDQLQYCPYRPLCTYTWEHTISEPTGKRFCCKGCSCAEDCTERLNCCPDILPANTFDLSVKQTIMHCMALQLKTEHYVDGIYAYKMCPGAATADDAMKCTRNYDGQNVRIIDILPVTDKNNITYRNIFCALCNNVQAEDLVFWGPKLVCKTTTVVAFSSQEDLISFVFDSKDCDIRFINPIQNLININNSCKVSVSECNVTGLWKAHSPFYEWACSSYSSPLMSGNGTYFENVFCMICNGHTRMNTFCSGGDSSNGVDIFSFAALLNVGGMDDEIDENIQCTDGLMLMGNCYTTQCSVLRTFDNGECSRIIGPVYDMAYVINFRMIPIMQMSAKLAYENVYTSMKELSQYISMSFGFAHIQTIECLLHLNTPYYPNISTNDILKSNLLFYDMRFKLQSMALHDPESIFKTFKNLSGQNFTVYGNGNSEAYTFDVRLKDDTGFIFDKFDSTSTFKQNDDHDLFPSQSTSVGSMVPLSRFQLDSDTTVLPFLTDSYGSKSKVINRVNIMSMQSCPFIDISTDKLDWQEAHTGFHLQNAGLFLNFSDFFYDTNSSDIIKVCPEIFLKIMQVSVMQGTQNKSLSPPIESVLSLVCVSLSIAALLFSIVALSCLTGFQTLPWKNNFALLLSLLFAQGLYLFGSFGPLIKESIACKTVGILVHFFLLMFVFWMNICTFHIFRNLSKTKLPLTGSGWRKFAMYFAYSLTSSTTFVLLNVVISLIYSQFSDIGYGKNICYINSQNMVIFTFGIPVSCVIACNLFMFGVVVVKLNRAEVAQKNVINERSQIMIFAKLSSLTGLTWLFGVIYMLTNVEAFSYIFIVFNASQGVFLMVSFVINGRFLKAFYVHKTKTRT